MGMGQTGSSQTKTRARILDRLQHRTCDEREPVYLLHGPAYHKRFSHIRSSQGRYPRKSYIRKKEIAVRKIVGATDPLDARPGTIRGDFAQQIGRNLIHASDSPENAKNEIGLWFIDQEINSYEKIDEAWLYE